MEGRRQAVQVHKKVTWSREARSLSLSFNLLLLGRAGKGEEVHVLILRGAWRGEVYMLIETGEIRIQDP